MYIKALPIFKDIAPYQSMPHYLFKKKTLSTNALQIPISQLGLKTDRNTDIGDDVNSILD